MKRDKFSHLEKTKITDKDGNSVEVPSRFILSFVGKTVQEMQYILDEVNKS